MKRVEEDSIIAVGPIETKIVDPRFLALEDWFYSTGYAAIEAHANARDFALFLQGSNWIVRKSVRGENDISPRLTVDICQPDGLISITFAGAINRLTTIESGAFICDISHPFTKIREGDKTGSYDSTGRSRYGLPEADRLFFENNTSGDYWFLFKEDGRIRACLYV